MKRIYISGKITGMELATAQDLFEKAENRVKEMGFHPVNPMKEVPFNPEWDWARYMLADIAILFDCDSMYMLSNWKDSRGARIEHNIGVQTGKNIIYENSH